MKKTRIIGIAVLIVGGGLALHVARAQQRKADGRTAGSTHGAPLREPSLSPRTSRSRTCRGSAWLATSSTTPGASSIRTVTLGFHLRLRPLGRDPERGR